jgi:hypothetical protein
LKNALGFLLADSRHSTYHLVSLAVFALGFFVTLTAADLGPFAPLLLSSGIYLVIFSMLLQIVFWLKTGLRKALSSWLAA